MLVKREDFSFMESLKKLIYNYFKKTSLVEKNYEWSELYA